MDPVVVSRRMPALRRPGRQQGFSLIEAALVVLLIGSAIAVGFLVLKARKPADQATAQEEALRWADQALVTYAATHAALPCAVATPTSAPTDCVAAGQKGWLPVQALEAVHPGGAKYGQPLRYMVYRGGNGADLAAADETFSPHQWDGVSHGFDAVNGLDMCARLQNAARETAAGARADRARTTDIDGNLLNVAYGLGAAGPTAGNAGGRFDGANAGSEAVLESPARTADSGYDDRVRVRDFRTLAQTLGCAYADAANPDGVALASLDMLALAVDVSDEVTEQHEQNKQDTQSAVEMAIVSEVFAVLNVALSAASISNSVSTLATASSQLSAAIASCVVLVGCGLIPPYTAAVIAAGVAIGLASAATGLAAGALTATSVALGLTVEARNLADQPIGTGAADIAEITEKTCIAAEGGYVSQLADANGNLYTVDPPVWKDGLKQDVEKIEQELLEIQADVDANTAWLAELEQIPSVRLIEYPPAPTRGEKESDESWNARYQAWLDSRAYYERMLQAKLEKIRTAETLHFAWDEAVQEEENAQKELSQMQQAVLTMTTRVAECDASPPPASDILATQRCQNDRQALRGMTTCDADVLTSTQVQQRQCLPWKQEDYAAAQQARSDAESAYRAAEWEAVAMAEPPIKDYIPTRDWWPFPWDCSSLGLCDPLIVWRQSDDDKRETYAKSVYKSFGLQVALREKRKDLDEKKAAYDSAQAQCDALRAMDPNGSGGGAPVAFWSGADAILRAADCKGATGPVQPSDCAAP